MKKILAMLGIMASLIFTGCGGDEPVDGGHGIGTNTETVIRVGAMPKPHAEILESVKTNLKDQGIDLQIVEFQDYTKPNLALNNGEIDANFFQHKQYFDNAIKENPELKLVNVGVVHVEPMGIYSSKFKKLEDIPFGATVSIPDDPTNRDRALLLLDKAKLITLREGIENLATVEDIISNDNDLKINTVDAAQVASTLNEVDVAVINTNFAMDAGLNPISDAIFIENNTSPYTNIVVVRAGDENRPEIKTLIKVLQSEQVKKFIKDNYNGAIVPVF